ncbi:uncharacterized protein MYCGRDRAFT_104464, partial [Zymoseptoria tritici IPO323]
MCWPGFGAMPGCPCCSPGCTPGVGWYAAIILLHRPLCAPCVQDKTKCGYQPCQSRLHDRNVTPPAGNWSNSSLSREEQCIGWCEATPGLILASVVPTRALLSQKDCSDGGVVSTVRQARSSQHSVNSPSHDGPSRAEMRRGLDKVAGGGQSRASPERQTVWAERRKSPEVAVKFRSLGLGGEKAEL